MEYVGAGTLEDFRQTFAEGPMPAEKAVEIMAQVAEGLSVAHGQRPAIIHRDLKPQNILVQEDPDGIKVKISDFGLAQEVNPLTLMTAAAGTLSFKAPEAVFADGVDSKASDIWSLGVILYLLLTDRLPYPAPTQWGWNNTAFQNPHRPPSTLNIDANDALDSIVKKCLRLEPHQRYAKTGTLLGDLKRWKPTKPHEAKPRRTDPTKVAFAQGGQADDSTLSAAKKLQEEARQLANEQRLTEAAERLEEAMRLQPDLRDKHAKRVELWRKGLSS
jgi:serine/threonine-protein kinase